jgi:DNA end-binding protein Ku
MRTMWKGAISFGLVTIPVKMFSATDEKTVRFNQLHGTDGGRIRYRRTCSADGEEVPYNEIVKGYEYEKDRYVILTDEDLEAIALPSSRAIEIQRFVESEEIDPIYFQRSYYLVPETTGVKAYALLREAMADQSKVAVCKVTFRDREHLATLRRRDNALVLETMYWPDEIRSAEFEELDSEVDVRPQEVKMARSLIESLTEPFNPDEFKDEYRAAIENLIQRKIQGQEITHVETPEPAKVVDLMEALRASVEAAKAGREEAPKEAAQRRRKKVAGE